MTNAIKTQEDPWIYNSEAIHTPPEEVERRLRTIDLWNSQAPQTAAQVYSIETFHSAGIGSMSGREGDLEPANQNFALFHQRAIAQITLLLQSIAPMDLSLLTLFEILGRQRFYVEEMAKNVEAEKFGKWRGAPNNIEVKTDLSPLGSYRR